MSGERSTLDILLETLGGADIYLVDQLMKGRLPRGSRILDAGCGGGRNIEPFLRAGYEVLAVDSAPRATLQTSRLARELRAQRPAGWVSRQDVSALGFRSESFDAVFASAVLHFSPDRARFDDILDELWRVLAPGGLFFARLASTIGIEDRVVPLGGGRFRLPNGVEWLMVDRGELLAQTERLGGRLIEPIKTTVVDVDRAMTTWCLGKPSA